VSKNKKVPYKAKFENYTTKADLHQWLKTTRLSKGYSMTLFSWPVLYLCGIVPIFSDFINCRCIGEVVGDEIIIKMKKKATTPIFKSNEVFQKTYPIPWLGNKRLSFNWIS
jgi:hypothetical protein